MIDYALIIQGLRKRFGELEVLGGIDTALPARRITAFIGPNGAGKTTLFQAITGEIRPDGGKVILHGSDITGKEPWQLARMGIGKMFQDVRVFSGLSPLQNVVAALHRQSDRTLGSSILRNRDTLNEENDLANMFLDRVGLDGLRDAPAGELSWGNQKLLAFARLLAGDFSFVLLDEPVAGVSPILKLRLLELIRELAAKGVTVALIEHDMAFVRDLANAVVVLKEGHVFEQGPADEVLTQPATIELCFGI